MSSKKTPDPPPDARTGGGPDAENAPGRLAAEHAQALAALRERVKELDCLYDITRLSQRQDLTLGDMLAGVAQIVARAWQYPEVTCARVVVGGRAFATQNYRRPKSRQSSPVSVRGERIGRIEVGYLEERPDSGEGPFLREERKLIDAVAEHLARIIEARKAEERLRALSRELIKAQEDERQRIARELHDNVAQELSMLRIGLEALPELAGRAADEACALAGDLSSRLGAAITALRDLSYDLLPPALDQLGLAEAAFRLCEELTARHGLEVNFFADGMEQARCGFETRVNLYRILQEALNNARRHAGAKRIVVRLVASHPNLILRVEDDGRGFEPESRLVEALAEKRLGLWSMRERARLLGGRLTIRSRPGAGTRITVEVPCQEGA
jgi:signal transduction histidine kinase